MKPTYKSPKIREFLDDLSARSYGRKASKSIEDGICTNCGETAKEFKNFISMKEYMISGFCQECQDKFFGESND